jgi:hypothetical protein
MPGLGMQLVGSVVAGALAQPDNCEPIRAWLDREVEAARALPDLGLAGLAWEESSAPRPLAEIEESNRAAREQGGPVSAGVIQAGTEWATWAQTLFSDGAGRWRFCTTFSDNVFVDVALDRERAWMLSQDRLTRLSTDGPFEGSTSRTKADANVFGPIVGRLVYGGLDVVARARLERTSVTCDGDQWIARYSRPIEAPPALTVEFRGTWDPALARGCVRQSIMIENGYKPEAVGSTDIYGEWSRVGELGLWVAGRVEMRDAQGTLTRWIRAVAPVSPSIARFDEVVKEPDPVEPDPVRGSPTFRSVFDYRRGVRSSIDALGRSVHAPLVTLGPTSDAPPGWLRPAGWGVLAALVAGFVVAWRNRRLAGV